MPMHASLFMQPSLGGGRIKRCVRSVCLSRAVDLLEVGKPYRNLKCVGD